MPESDATTPLVIPRSVEVDQADRRRTRRRQLLGAGLTAYGLIGIVVFLAVAVAISRPLERVRELSESVEEQRALLVDSMEQGESTIREMADGVRRMDTSLSSARAATSRSSQIALDVATSMFQLRDAMSITILGAQPLLGIAAGFDQTGNQLQLLSSDLTAIGTSLETNSADIVTTAANLEQLAQTVATLRVSVDQGPEVAISTEALDTFRLALFAVAGWLLVFAVGCVVTGAYIFTRARRGARDLVD